MKIYYLPKGQDGSKICHEILTIIGFKQHIVNSI